MMKPDIETVLRDEWAKFRSRMNTLPTPPDDSEDIDPDFRKVLRMTWYAGAMTAIAMFNDAGHPENEPTIRHSTTYAFAYCQDHPEEK